jgi:hypothetical protein
VFLVPSGQHQSERQDRSQVNEKPISTDAFKVVRTGCAALASLIGNLGFVAASDPAASPATPCPLMALSSPEMVHASKPCDTVMSSLGGTLKVQEFGGADECLHGKAPTC